MVEELRNDFEVLHDFGDPKIFQHQLRVVNDFLDKVNSALMLTNSIDVEGTGEFINLFKVQLDKIKDEMFRLLSLLKVTVESMSFYNSKMNSYRKDVENALDMKHRIKKENDELKFRLNTSDIHIRNIIFQSINQNIAKINHLEGLIKNISTQKEKTAFEASVKLR